MVGREEIRSLESLSYMLKIRGELHTQVLVVLAFFLTTVASRRFLVHFIEDLYASYSHAPSCVYMSEDDKWSLLDTGDQSQ